MDLIAVNALFLTQEVDTNIKGVTPENRITFTDAQVQNLASGEVSTHFAPRHLATLVKTTNVAVSNTLVFTQTTQPRVTDLAVVSWIHFVQETRDDDKAPLVSQTLSMTGAVVESVAKGTYSSLVLTQSVSLSMTRNFPVGHTLAMVSRATGYLPDYFWQSYPIGDF